MKYDGIKKAEVVIKDTPQLIRREKRKKKDGKSKKTLVRTLFFQAAVSIVLGGVYYLLCLSDSSAVNTITGEVRRAIIYNIGYDIEENGKSELVDNLLDNAEKA